MAAPFVFTPGTATIPLQPTQYLQPYYTQNPHTPVMPQNVTLAPMNVSPMGQHAMLIPAPHPHVHVEDGSKHGRPKSWHADSAGLAPVTFPPPSPQAAAQPVVPAVLAAPPSPHLHVPMLGHGRRHSFGQPGTQPPAWLSAYATPQMVPAYPQQPQQWMLVPTGVPQPAPAPAPEKPKTLIHPLLDGSSKPPAGDLWFDLSAHEFAPLRRQANGVVTPLTAEELEQPATHPPQNKMKIVCDAIPQWPVELALESEPPAPALGLDLGNMPAWAQQRMQPPPPEEVPITLRDVLECVYRVLQTQITHLEWAKLSKSEEMAAARAYTRRIKNAGDAGDEETTLGVKRVDYLLDKYMFRGIVPAKGSSGFENCKMILSGSK